MLLFSLFIAVVDVVAGVGLVGAADPLDERRAGVQRHARAFDGARTFPGERNPASTWYLAHSSTARGLFRCGLAF